MDGLGANSAESLFLSPKLSTCPRLPSAHSYPLRPLDYLAVVAVAVVPRRSASILDRIWNGEAVDSIIRHLTAADLLLQLDLVPETTASRRNAGRNNGMRKKDVLRGRKCRDSSVVTIGELLVCRGLASGGTRNGTPLPQ